MIPLPQRYLPVDLAQCIKLYHIISYQVYGVLLFQLLKSIYGLHLSRLCFCLIIFCY